MPVLDTYLNVAEAAAILGVHWVAGVRGRYSMLS